MTAEEFDVLPEYIKEILSTFDTDGDEYKEAKRIVQELELIGWTCDYDLSGTIFDVMQQGKN